MRIRLLPLAFLLAALPLTAADWPQFRGPDRTGISKESGLLKEWPKDGPKLLWTHEDTGIGYAGPSIVGDRLYIMGSDGDKEYLYAINVKDGKRAWKAEVGDHFSNPWGSGPRGTPTVEGKFVYALGGKGTLLCAETDKGKKVWSVNLKDDLGG